MRNEEVEDLLGREQDPQPFLPSYHLHLFRVRKTPSTTQPGVRPCPCLFMCSSRRFVFNLPPPAAAASTNPDAGPFGGFPVVSFGMFSCRYRLVCCFSPRAAYPGKVGEPRRGALLVERPDGHALGSKPGAGADGAVAQRIRSACPPFVGHPWKVGWACLCRCFPLLVLSIERGKLAYMWCDVGATERDWLPY